MLIATRSFPLLLALTLAPTGGLAQAPTETPAELKDHEPSGITLAKLVAIKNLRCDSLTRGKRARLRADVHRSEVTTAFGPNKITAEQRVSQAEEEAGAAFEEAANLKRRLGDMLDRYVADQRLQWYQTSDEAERVRLEQVISEGRELAEEPCEVKGGR